jgi:hypothetical protein
MSSGHRRIQERFDWGQMEPSTAVVETVANVAGSDPRDIDILSNSINPDALDRLVRGPERHSQSVSVTFRFAGYKVVVHGDGEIVVRSLAE